MTSVEESKNENRTLRFLTLRDLFALQVFSLKKYGKISVNVF